MNYHKRTNINEQFHRIYEHAIFVAAKVNVEPERPRTAGRQAHRNNAPTTKNENKIESIWNLMKGFQMLYNNVLVCCA